MIMIRWLRAIAFLLVGSVSAVALASIEGPSNTLRDIWLQSFEERATLVLKLDRRASWKLGPISNRRMKLILGSVKPADRVEARIVEDNSGALSASMQKGEEFLTDLNFGKVLRRVDYSFDPQKHQTVLCLFWPKPEQKVTKFTDKPVLIKKTRYGKRRGFDRLVVELSGKPTWWVEWKDSRHLAIRINKCKQTKRWDLHSGRYIEKASILASGSYAVVSIETKQQLNNFRVFWLEVGNRLVLDVMSPNAPLLAMAENLPQDFGKPLPYNRSVIRKMEGGSARVFKAFEINVVQESKSEPAPKVIKKISKPVSTGPSPSRPTVPRPQIKMNKSEALEYGRILGALNFREYEKGVRLIDRFLKKFPGSPLREKLLFMKGQFYLKEIALGNSTKLYATISSFKKFIQEFPHSPMVAKAYLNMAKASRLGGDYYGAMGYLNVLFERDIDKAMLPAAYLERATVYESLQLTDKAFQDFNTIVRRFPGSAESKMACLGIARYLHNKGLYDEAEKWFHEIETKYPDFPSQNPAFFALRGKNDLYLKRFARARKLFLEAINLGDNTEPIETVLTRVADTYLFQGKKEAAKKLYTFVVTHFPDSETVSVAQLRLADLTSGIDKFKKLHERYGDAPLGELALLKLANVYFRNKAYEKAMEALKEMVVKPAKDDAGKAAKTLFLQAMEEAIKQAYQEGRYQDCIGLYEKNKALVRSELSTSARLYLAEALFETGGTKDALKILGPFDPTALSAEIRPRYVMVYAEALKAAGQVLKAVKILEKERRKLKDERWRAKYSLFLGKCYQEMGELSNALSEYRRSVDCGKGLDRREQLSAWLEIGKIQNVMGKVLEARDALNRCLKLAANTRQYRGIRLSALLELAKSYTVQGSPSGAAKILESILEQGYGPGGEYYWEVKFRLARCYEQMGAVDRAKALYKEISDEGPSILQARAQIRLGSIVLNDRLRALPHWSELASR